MTWHVAMVLPNRESRVVAELREMGFEALWPRIRRREMMGGSRRDWRGRERWVTTERSLFPNYIIFRDSPRIPWQEAQGVSDLSVVLRQPGDRNRAARLPEAIVERLRGNQGDGVVEDIAATIEVLHHFARGDRVRVREGIAAGLAGTVLSTTYGRVRLLIGALELSVPAELVVAA